MAKKKLKMAFIENESTRKSTYKKRKKGIMKKAYELATLCDVPLAIIMESSEFELSPMVYPSKEAVEEVVSQWQSVPEMDKSKRMMNQESYLNQRISKATESYLKVKKQNRELAMKEVMFDCLRGTTSPSNVEKSDLVNFGNLIDQYIKDLDRRMDVLMMNDGSSSSYVPAPPATTTTYVPAAATRFAAMPIVEMGSSSRGFLDLLMMNDGSSSSSVPAVAATASVHAAGATTSGAMPIVETGSSSSRFDDMIQEQIQNNQKMKQNIRDLDLNKTQW